MSNQISTVEETQVAAGARVSGKPPGPLRRTQQVLSRKGNPTSLVIALVLVAAALWAAGAGPFINLIAQSCVVFAIAAIGQSILVGGAGQIAFSGAAFMALGAFTSGTLAANGVDNFFVLLISSALVGLLVGLIAGLPGLRFRGLYLLLASIALQFIVFSLTREYQHATSPAGFTMPRLMIGSVDFTMGLPLYVLLLVMLLLVFITVALVERTGVGLAWKALRESEVAAAMSGVDVVRWKLYAFAASGAVTAVAGCLFAYWVGRVDYETYNLQLTITLVTMIYIGGIHSRLGAILGAVVITVLPYFLQSGVSVWLVDAGFSFDWYLNNQSILNAGLFSLMFLLVVLFEPTGILGLLTKLETWLRGLGRKRSSPQAEEEAA